MPKDKLIIERHHFEAWYKEQYPQSVWIDMIDKKMGNKYQSDRIQYLFEGFCAGFNIACKFII